MYSRVCYLMRADRDAMPIRALSPDTSSVVKPQIII